MHLCLLALLPLIASLKHGNITVFNKHILPHIAINKPQSDKKNASLGIKKPN